MKINCRLLIQLPSPPKRFDFEEEKTILRENSAGPSPRETGYQEIGRTIWQIPLHQSSQVIQRGFVHAFLKKWKGDRRYVEENKM